MRGRHAAGLGLVALTMAACGKPVSHSATAERATPTHTLELRYTLPPHPYHLSRVKVGKGSYPYVLSFDVWQGRAMWDGLTGQPVWQHLRPNSDRIRETLAVEFARDGDAFTTGGMSWFGLESAADGDGLRGFYDPEYSSREPYYVNAAFSENGQLVAAFDQKYAVTGLWDSESGGFVRRFLEEGCGWTATLGFSRDHRLLIHACPGHIAFWDISSGMLAQRVSTGDLGVSGSIARAAFTPVLDYMAVTVGREILLVDLETKTVSRRFPFEHTTARLQFSEDATALVALAPSGHLTKWDILTGEVLASTGARPINACGGIAIVDYILDLSPDGETVVGCTGDSPTIWALRRLPTPPI